MLRKMMMTAILSAGILMGGLPLQASTPLTNNDVITLSQAGVGEDAIVAAIQAQGANYDVSVPALLKLKQDGISPKILRAMVAAMNKRGMVSTSAAPVPATQPTATLTANPAPASDPAAPANGKKSWRKALGAMSQALSSAGVSMGDGTGHLGGSFKDSFISGFKNAISRQSQTFGAGVNGFAPSGNANFAAPQQQTDGYYATPNGNVTPVQNRIQSAPESNDGYGAPVLGQSAQRALAFSSWRDPREAGFTISVPQGWQITGGMSRTSAMDPHPVVYATSPDRSIQIFYGDPNLIPREIPNQLTSFAHISEGQITKGAWGGPILMARYQTGEQFARSYAASRLCRAPQTTGSRVLQDATRQLNAEAVSYGRTQGASAQAWVGETDFQCGTQTGYVRASTVLAGSATGQGVGMWFVMELNGFMAADHSRAGLARYILNTMAGSFKLDPQWEARQAQTTRDVTGAVTRAQHQMAETIAQTARQQAQSNQVDVMSGWEARNKVMDGVMKRDSDTRRGITTATDSITGDHTVSNDYTYHWTRPDGTIVGTNTDTPPDYNSGWRMMGNGSN